MHHRSDYTHGCDPVVRFPRRAPSQMANRSTNLDRHRRTRDHPLRLPVRPIVIALANFRLETSDLRHQTYARWLALSVHATIEISARGFGGTPDGAGGACCSALAG